MSTSSQNNHISNNTTNQLLTRTKIQEWLVSYIAEMLEIQPDEVHVNTSLECYSLDSTMAVGMTADLEDWLGYELDPTLIYDYPTIEALTQHLTEELKVKTEGKITL